jgi:hypothetical protein
MSLNRRAALLPAHSIAASQHSSDGRYGGGVGQSVERCTQLVDDVRECETGALDGVCKLR